MNGCPYCTTTGERKPIPGWGGGELEVVQITPMPAINLTTGERDTTAEAPFWAMNFTAFQNELEEFVPINNCPMCGRTLPVKQIAIKDDAPAHRHVSITMVQCNNCMSSFPEDRLIFDGSDEREECCPICGESGCLMDLEEDCDDEVD